MTNWSGVLWIWQSQFCTLYKAIIAKFHTWLDKFYISLRKLPWNPNWWPNLCNWTKKNVFFNNKKEVLFLLCQFLLSLLMYQNSVLVRSGRKIQVLPIISQKHSVSYPKKWMQCSVQPLVIPRSMRALVTYRKILYTVSSSTSWNTTWLWNYVTLILDIQRMLLLIPSHSVIMNSGESIFDFAAPVEPPGEIECCSIVFFSPYIAVVKRFVLAAIAYMSCLKLYPFWSHECFYARCTCCSYNSVHPHQRKDWPESVRGQVPARHLETSQWLYLDRASVAELCRPLFRNKWTDLYGTVSMPISKSISVPLLLKFENLSTKFHSASRKRRQNWLLSVRNTESRSLGKIGHADFCANTSLILEENTSWKLLITYN